MTNDEIGATYARELEGFIQDYNTLATTLFQLCKNFGGPDHRNPFEHAAKSIMSEMARLISCIIAKQKDCQLYRSGEDILLHKLGQS